MKHKTAIVTGSNSGIGLVTAQQLADWGASVIVAARRKSSPSSSADVITPLTKTRAIEFVPLDLADFQSILHFAETLLGRRKSVDLLINNAGVMMCPFSLTRQGFELQFGTNHLGHFLLTVLLIPALRRSSDARVINVSSNAHAFISQKKDASGKTLAEKYWELMHNLQTSYQDKERDLPAMAKMVQYDPVQGYSYSKLANVMFSWALNSRAEEARAPIRVVSLHPGSVRTNLYRYFSSVIQALVALPNMLVMKNIISGAQTTLYCSATPDLLAGHYYSDCQAVSCVQMAKTKTEYERLWEQSLQMTHLSEDHISSLLTFPIEEATEFGIQLAQKLHGEFSGEK